MELIMIAGQMATPGKAVANVTVMNDCKAMILLRSTSRLAICGRAVSQTVPCISFMLGTRASKRFRLSKAVVLRFATSLCGIKIARHLQERSTSASPNSYSIVTYLESLRNGMAKQTKTMYGIMILRA